MIRIIAVTAAAWLLCGATAAAAPPCYDLGHAGTCPALCPPHRYACWQVRAAVRVNGEETVASRARDCGWSEREIAEARRCLR